MRTLKTGKWASSLVVAALVWTAGCLVAQASSLINVQFGTDGSIRKSGPAALGEDPADFWNLYSRDLPDGSYKTVGSLAELKWADGSASGSGLVLENAPGAWGNGFPDPMFGAYLYCFDGQPLTLTFTNLPPGTYDVLAYGHGGPPNVQNTAFELFSGGVSWGLGRTSTRADWTNTAWSAGVHYFRFSGVPVYTNLPLTLVSRPDAIPLALINGVQLLRVNDTPVGTPSTNPPPPPPVDPPVDPSNPPSATNGLPAGLLNINFGVNDTPARRGPAAIGQDASDFWNRYSRDDGAGGFRHSGGLTTVYWANGAPSGAGLRVENAAGAWGNGVDDPMFGVFLYPLSDDPNVRVTLTNLPPGYYTLLVYAHGGPPDNHTTTVEALSGTTSLGEKRTSMSGWASTQWEEGKQYVRFESVSVEPDTVLTILAKPADHAFGMINGLQLRLDAPWELRPIPSGGFFTNELLVRLVGAVPPREIRYTLDGTAPTVTSPKYVAPIRLKASAQLHAAIFNGDEREGEGVVSSYQRVYALDDGIPSGWRQQYFGDGYRTDPRVAADADPDGDGATNLQEFSTGTDPLDPLSGFLVRTRLVPSVTWKSEPGKTYRIRRKETLGDPEWHTVAEIQATEPISRFVDADVANVDSFYIVEPVR